MCDCVSSGDRVSKVPLLQDAGSAADAVLGEFCICRSNGCECNESLKLPRNWRRGWVADIVLRVHGMTCNGCANTIRDRLVRDPRVGDITADIAKGTISVQLSAGNAATSALVNDVKEAITELGFDVETDLKYTLLLDDVQAQLTTADTTTATTTEPGTLTSAPGHEERAQHAVANLHVVGMTCSSCAAAIENALMQHAGIVSASISVMEFRAVVNYDASKITDKEIASIIQDVGFEATVVEPEGEKGTATLDLDDCDDETAQELETFLRSLPGVQEAVVDATSRRVSLTYDADKGGVRDFIQVIKQRFDRTASVRSRKASTNTAAVARQRELLKWKRLLIASAVLAVPLALITMILPRIDSAIMDGVATKVVRGISVEYLVAFILSTPVQFWIGKRFYRGAYKSLRKKFANMDVLIAGGTSAAYIYSVIVGIIQLANPEFEGHHYYETSALLIAFVVMGKYLEALAKGKTSQALYKLMDLQVDSAVVVTLRADGSVEAESSIAIELLQRNDVLKVVPGSKVPADGVVVLGSSFVDESMVTGESMPVEKTKDDPVIAGTVNQKGLLFIRATKVGGETMLAQIVRLVEDAQTNKAPIQAIADKISGVFVPAVCALSLVAFFIWIAIAYTIMPEDWLPNNTGRFVFALLIFISTLVIACPCALGLATPTAVMVATGLGATNGILIKGGGALELACKVKAIIFDKTGTLTHGKPIVTDVIVSITFPSLQQCFAWYVMSLARMQHMDSSAPKDKLFVYAGRAETGSEHPLGRAIADHCGQFASIVDGCTDYEAIPGRGLRCKVDGADVVVGNETFMCETINASAQQLQDLAFCYQNDGKTVMFVAVAGTLLGAFAVADTVRPEARLVVETLAKQGVQVWMVTGDNERTAKAIAAQVGITKVFAQVLPKDKAEKVRYLQSQSLTTAMVGDGINDAPALSQADVGIAIGAGTDIAMESATIVLMKSDLRDVLTCIDISRKAFNRIKLNFMLAFGYNVLAIPLAAGVFYPLWHELIPPWIAGLAMALSSVSVICSSLALRLYKKPVYGPSATAYSSNFRPVFEAEEVRLS